MSTPPTLPPRFSTSGEEHASEAGTAEIQTGIKATLLSGTPREGIVPTLREKLAASVRTQILAGFATVDGMALIEPQLSANPEALDVLIVGIPTRRFLDSFDVLLARSVPRERLRVHLGHTRATKEGARYPFYLYHPRMHGCLYLMEHADGTASAFVGSQGLTGFSLLGMNIEFAVLLEGDASSPEFEKLRNQIESARAESVPYEATKKDGYVSLSRLCLDGFSAHAVARPGEAKKTVVILCDCAGTLPEIDDKIFFDVPAEMPDAEFEDLEIHLYVFDSLPASPKEGLERLSEARAAFWCTLTKAKVNNGSSYYHMTFLNDSPSRLERREPGKSPPHFPGTRRCRAAVRRSLRGRFQYQFEDKARRWTPELDDAQSITAPDSEAGILESLGLIPPQHLEWHAVWDVIPTSESKEYEAALRIMWPESGCFVLFSRRRVLLPGSPNSKSIEADHESSKPDLAQETPEHLEEGNARCPRPDESSISSKGNNEQE